MSQVGRIGGQALADNLLRAGVDLAFETDLLYLDVNNSKIGIKTSTPIYTVDVDSHIKTNVLTITGTGTVDGITFTAPNTIGSTVAPIDVYITGSTLFHDRLTTSAFEIDDNFIASFSNNNIVLDPHGTGTLEVYATTHIVGDLGVSGNILVPGNLKTDGTIIIGDAAADTVSIAPDLTQSIVPGDNILYDLGSSLKRWRNGYTNNANVNSGFTAGNITVASPSTISSTGDIAINISGPSPIASFTGDVKTSGIKIDGNLIESFSNQNIRFNPNGTGAINLESNSNITGNLRVSGNTLMSGNLTFYGTITVGDQTLDTVTINTDFTQGIIPGEDLVYALGADAGDSSPRKWAEIYALDWTKITNGAWAGSGLVPLAATISDQLTLDGVNNKISTIQSNEDVLLLPDTGITYIENTKWQNDYITNLSSTPLTFAGTGRGFLQYNGTNGFVIPTGNDSQRRLTPEVGETRWNTDQGYLECWTGTEWSISTGGGGDVTTSIMDDISNIWGLILG